MIKEAYVSYEVAKLLKEKGFDVPCHSHYWDKQVYMAGYTENFNRGFGDWVSRPTHQMALAWLREKGVIIVFDYNADDDCEENERWGFSVYTNPQRKVDMATYPTYEEAVEAAIKYSLENLI